MNKFWQGFEKRAGLTDWYTLTKSSPSYKWGRRAALATLGTALLAKGVGKAMGPSEDEIRELQKGAPK